MAKAMTLENPFRPGAGHMPPYLAGRDSERREFEKYLKQDPILQNIVLTGLRGLGKTVLLETFKPMAIQLDWLWAGTDLSESTSVDEQKMALRLLTDIAGVTSAIVIAVEEKKTAGLTGPSTVVERRLDFPTLLTMYSDAPGLVADKLKAVLETVWSHVKPLGKRGVIFAYDEAQNLADHAPKDEFPLSLLLDVFQSLQRKNIPYMLVLTGLPTLFPKLVEARTYAERMFHVISLEKLSSEETKQAITLPIKQRNCPISFTTESVEVIYSLTRGYPFFVQYVCREVFDIWSQQRADGKPLSTVPLQEIIAKLDADFFAGRWARATDRQRDLLKVIAMLPTAAGEFTVQEVVAQSKKTAKDFSPSHANQMLSDLTNAGLVYKNRWGKYSLAVPLLDEFIQRQMFASLNVRR